MRKKIMALMLIVITILMCLVIFANSNLKSVEAAEVRKVSVVVEEAEEEFTVDRIEEFVDENLMNYNLDQLEDLIEEKQEIQKEAEEIAESAKKLGWPEDCGPIYSANSEWLNAQKAIEVYNAQYEELYSKSEKARFDAKKAEYPAATEIWLFMKDLGWNDYVCAGIMGNLMAEVGGQTLDIRYTLCGKNYYGMCQWSRSYSQIWGAGLPEQCKFLRDTIKYEMDTFGYAYRKGFNLDAFLSMNNEKEAALAFAKCYERCNSKYYGIRQTNATKAYNYFVNN